MGRVTLKKFYEGLKVKDSGKEVTDSHDVEI